MLLLDTSTSDVEVSTGAVVVGIKSEVAGETIVVTVERKNQRYFTSIVCCIQPNV